MQREERGWALAVLPGLFPFLSFFFFLTEVSLIYNIVLVFICLFFNSAAWILIAARRIFFLVAVCGIHVGLSSPTRDRIQGPCIRSLEP